MSVLRVRPGEGHVFCKEILYVGHVRWASTFWLWLYVMLRKICSWIFSLELLPCLRFLRVRFLHRGIWPLYFSFQRLWIAYIGSVNIPVSPESHQNFVITINLYFFSVDGATLPVCVCIFLNLLWCLAIFLRWRLLSAFRSWASIASGHFLSLSDLHTVMASGFSGLQVLRRHPAEL